jgi:D-3-phosphoglycerate dehydrogenase
VKDLRQPRILVCDELNEAAMEVFRRRGLEPEVRTGLKQEELIKLVGDVDALIVRSATKITRPVIEAASALRVVGRAGIGVDNIDCEAATERGVVVMNTPRGNATTTAELAIALMLSLARHIPLADRQVRAGSWSKKGLMGSEITGKTLGVIGLGRIGRIVAERARGLGMKVCAFDPYLDAEAGGAGVELFDLDTLLARSDFVSLHVPLTESTRNLISWERLARIKPGCRLINAARGGVVDEEAVLDALAEGRLGGAAFDVFATEPPPADHPLLQRDDVIFTPHLGASSNEAQLRVAVDIAEQVADFLLDGVAQNAVNAPTLPPESMAEIAPFLLLAEKLGSFLAQRMGSPLRKLELTVAGAVARFGIEHLRLAVLSGVLRHTLDTGVNFVNAPRLARERGILVLESVQEEAIYLAGEITLRASKRAGGESREVSGAVFGREPRMVRVDGISLDLPLRGPLLVTRHRDEPGVIGLLGTHLGKHGVNIRRLDLAPPPEGAGGLATGFLSLYDTPDPSVVADIARMDPIVEVQLLAL